MSYPYNNYQSSSSSASSQQYSPPIASQNPHGQSPIFNYDNISTTSSSLNSNYGHYGYNTHSMRYYLSKSFDIEDDLEFCPEIPEHTSPTLKKFNPYTASVFSPGTNSNSNTNTPVSTSNSNPSSPRVSTPRIRKPIEIVNPQTKLRINSPASK